MMVYETVSVPRDDNRDPCTPPADGRKGWLEYREPNECAGRTSADPVATTRCGTCGATFATEGELDRHLQDAYHGFECLLCGAVFACARQLDDHACQVHDMRLETPRTAR